MPNQQIQDAKTYRVQGLSCANCANTFENNVKQLNGVSDAKVNFGASKIIVHGETTIFELEKAGAFENLKIRHEKELEQNPAPFWKQKENINVYVSAVLIFFSWLLARYFGEIQMLSTIGYAASMLLGGYSLFIKGLKNLTRLKIDMNTLIFVAIKRCHVRYNWYTLCQRTCFIESHGFQVPCFF